jgi:very-short-patch-repair endonuclease
MITQYDYVALQLARTKNKKHELYVVTGIIHRLNRNDVKFITQQYVRRDSGRALTDLYFPSLSLHIEVDEPFHLKQVIHDQLREADIIDATGHKVLRIPITGTLADINHSIDECVMAIRSKLAELGTDFAAWDMENEFAIEPHIERGYIDLQDNIAFRHITDACNCFGHRYKRHQRAGARHPHHPDILLWFPKLFENDAWNNRISSNEETIWELSKDKDNDKVQQHFQRWVQESTLDKRLVFAKAKDSLGIILYRFKGLYQIDRQSSNLKEGLCWRRIATRVQTYPQQVGNATG